jgi:hypothetical protein
MPFDDTVIDILLSCETKKPTLKTFEDLFPTQSLPAKVKPTVVFQCDANTTDSSPSPCSKSIITTSIRKNSELPRS